MIQSGLNHSLHIVDVARHQIQQVFIAAHDEASTRCDSEIDVGLVVFVAGVAKFLWAGMDKHGELLQAFEERAHDLVAEVWKVWAYLRTV